MAHSSNLAHTISVNKVLLEYSSPHHLHTVYGCFYITMAELSICNRDHMT